MKVLVKSRMFHIGCRDFRTISVEMEDLPSLSEALREEDREGWRISEELKMQKNPKMKQCKKIKLLKI